MSTIPIPDYAQRTRAQAGELARLSPTGQGEGLAAIGAAISDVAANEQLIRRRDAAADVAEALSTLRLKSAERDVQARRTAAPDAADFTKNAGAGFDEDVSEISESLRSTMARKLFRQHVIQAREDVIGRAMLFEASTRDAHRETAFQQNAARIATAVTLDPDSWRTAGAEQLAAIDELELPPERRAAMRSQVLDIITQGAALGFAKRDPVQTSARLADPKDPLFASLTPEARSAVQRAANSAQIEENVARIVAVYGAKGFEAGTQALTQLDKSGLSPAMQAEIRQDVSARLSQLRDQRRQENVATLSTIERAIANDSAGERTAQQVEQLYRIGALTPTEVGNYIGQIEASTVRRFRDEAAAREISAALGLGLPLDPKDPDHRKALRSAFAQDVREMPVGSPAWQATASAYAARARMLPDQALAWTRQTTRSPDPTVAATGAQFYGAIAAAAPDAVGEIDADTKAFAATVNSMIEGGTNPARAVETARTTVFDLKPEIRERRESEFKQHAKSSDVALANLVDRDFDPGLFASAPAASAGLAADFVSQSERYFAKTGDIALARDLAWSDLKRVYGPTKVNGSPMMIAFPPEQFGITPEDVRADIGSFLSSNPQADGSETEEIIVVPDAITMRQVHSVLDGRPVQPSYRLLTKSGDLVLDRHGVPKRYTLPSGEDLAERFRQAEAKAAAESQAVIDELKRMRDERREQERQYSRQSTAAGVHR